MTNAAAVRPLPLRELLPWTVLVPVLLLAIWLAAFDQGEVSRTGALLHELMHDGRHLLAAPCH
jgi:hypothetical protein